MNHSSYFRLLATGLVLHLSVFSMNVLAVDTVNAGSNDISGGSLTFSNPIRLVHSFDVRSPNIEVTSITFPYTQAFGTARGGESFSGGYQVSPYSNGNGLISLYPNVPVMTTDQERDTYIRMNIFTDQGSPAFKLRMDFSEGTVGQESYFGLELFAKDAICSLGGSNHHRSPTCASMGITFNRSEGTLSFASTPLANASTKAMVNTLTGTVRFPSF